MMKQDDSKSKKKFAVLLLVPAFAVFLLAFAKPEYSYSASVLARQNEIVANDSDVALVISADTLRFNTSPTTLCAFGSNEPSNVTYYVDGKEISSINDVNQNDIHSMSIFKGKAAMELYGKENVVLIVTKKQVMETGTEEHKNESDTLSGETKGISYRPLSTKENEPLIVIDGREYSGNIKDIDTNKIESLSVIKDATAVTLYGEKGRNGVIIITTKAAAEAKTHNP
jgi:TonB-dependent SusC/RagA subfamily outer membrane receptor